MCGERRWGVIKPIIIDINNCSECVEVYESKPNHFMIYTIYTLLAIVVTACIWMSFFRVDDVVKSNGLFRNSEEIYEVGSAVTGVVKEKNVTDGDYVNKGDILYVVESESLSNTILMYSNNLKNAKDRLDMLDAYEESLNGSFEILERMSENQYYEEFKNRRELLFNGIENNKKIAILTEKVSISGDRLTLNEKIAEYENCLNEYNTQSENCTIKASVSGYYYDRQNLKPGSYVQKGNTVGQIYPEKESDFYAEVYIKNSDIGRIKEDQDVKIEIAAYPSKEYGYFKGKIVSISKDISVDESTGYAYYVAKVKCDNMYVKNKDGAALELKNGMACQAKIIVGDKTVMTYVLEKINLTD